LKEKVGAEAARVASGAGKNKLVFGRVPEAARLAANVGVLVLLFREVTSLVITRLIPFATLRSVVSTILSAFVRAGSNPPIANAAHGHGVDEGGYVKEREQEHSTSRHDREFIFDLPLT
jgi:hypothetical protein